MKFYVNDINELNEYERKHNKISYGRLIERIGKIWLFNKAPELSEYDFEYLLNSDYNEETGDYIDIYQYYLLDINEYTLKKLQDLKCKDLIIAYSDKLEEYVLMVDHYGTSWDYVLTDFEPTTELKDADI